MSIQSKFGKGSAVALSFFVMNRIIIIDKVKVVCYNNPVDE